MIKNRIVAVLAGLTLLMAVVGTVSVVAGDDYPFTAYASSCGGSGGGSGGNC